MKGRSLILSAILILAAGLILILTYKTTKTDGIVMVGGVLFIVAGLLNIFTYLGERPSKKEIDEARREGREPRQRSSLSSVLAWTSSSAAVILGLSMLLFTPTFSTLVPFAFALLITFGAIYQFYLLAIGTRPLRLPAWLFIVPVLMLGAAIYVFMQKPGDDNDEQLIMLISGIAFTLMSVTMFIESILIGSANREQLAKAHKAPGSAKSVTAGSVSSEAHPLDDSAE